MMKIITKTCITCTVGGHEACHGCLQPGHRLLVHFEVDGIKDWVYVSGHNLIELQDKACAKVKKRGGKNPWAEISAESMKQLTRIHERAKYESNR
jgi:hypothetical protein